MSKKKLNIPLSEFINLKEKKPEDMTGCVVLYKIYTLSLHDALPIYKNGGLDVATWHSDAYRLGEERGYFKQGCFYMGKEKIVAWLSINDYVIDMNDSD